MVNFVDRFVEIEFKVKDEWMNFISGNFDTIEWMIFILIWGLWIWIGQKFWILRRSVMKLFVRNYSNDSITNCYTLAKKINFYYIIITDHSAVVINKTNINALKPRGG